MKSRIILTFVIAVGMWTSTGAQPEKERCGTRQPGLDAVDQIEQRISRARKVKTAVTIPVWVHVINKGSGFANGDLPEAMIRQQIRVLEDSYSGRTGGAGSGFDFQLAGITRTTNQTWFEKMAIDFEVELEAKTALKRPGSDTLNIYTVDGGPYLVSRTTPTSFSTRSTRFSTASYWTGDRCPGGPSRFTVKGIPHRTRSATGSRCITRSKTSAAARAISSRTRPRSSARRSSVRSAATPAPAPPSPESIQSSTSWTTRRTRACSCSRRDRWTACRQRGRRSGLSTETALRSFAPVTAPGGRTVSSCSALSSRRRVPRPC
jgi:hypothetical protein